MDKRHKKKLKRAAKKKKEKLAIKAAQNKLNKQLGLFSQMGNKCSTCEKEFPRTKEAHNSWRVAVNTTQQKVWLFCPDCQRNAKDMAGSKNEI